MTLYTVKTPTGKLVKKNATDAAMILYCSIVWPRDYGGFEVLGLPTRDEKRVREQAKRANALRRKKS